MHFNLYRSHYIHKNEWDVIIHHCENFKALDLNEIYHKAWIYDDIQQKIMHVITHPCPNPNYFLLGKRVARWTYWKYLYLPYTAIIKLLSVAMRRMMTIVFLQNMYQTIEFIPEIITERKKTSFCLPSKIFIPQLSTRVRGIPCHKNGNMLKMHLWKFQIIGMKFLNLSDTSTQQLIYSDTLKVGAQWMRFYILSCSLVTKHSLCTTAKFWMHIEAGTTWPPFRRRHFQTHFLQWKCYSFD